MSREVIEQAKQLMRSGHYHAARRLLEPLDSIDADELLIELDALESQRPSLLRSGYALALLLGLLVPTILALAAFLLAGGFEMARVAIEIPTPLPTLLPVPTRTPTPTPTITPTPTVTSTPTDTLTPSATSTSTRVLPPTWTPTDRPVFRTPDTTATGLVYIVQTGQALVAATDTMAARSAALRIGDSPVLGVSGTPDEACSSESRAWWRTARLIAADTFFNLADDYDAKIEMAQGQPDQYRGLLESLRVDFLTSLRQEVINVDYPPCAHTAREMLLAHMQQRLLAFASIAAGDEAAYETYMEQAATYNHYFERELAILRVARQ